MINLVKDGMASSFEDRARQKPRHGREMKNVWPEARYQPRICRKRMRISHGRSVDRMGRSESDFLSKASLANGGIWSFLRTSSPRMTADRSRSPSIPASTPRAGHVYEAKTNASGGGAAQASFVQGATSRQSPTRRADSGRSRRTT